MDSTRYDQLKQMVAEYGMCGKLDVQHPLSQETISLMTTSHKDAMTLIITYCSTTGTPMYTFYGFELAGRFDGNKFLCLSEHNGKVIFGTPASSKKLAKSQCALRILNTLMDEKRLSFMGPDGKKLKQTKSPATATSTMSVASIGADPYAEFQILNPIPLDCTDLEISEAVRYRAFELFNQLCLSQPIETSAETQAYLQASERTSTSILNEFCVRALPEYYIFTFPNIITDKYACLAKFEEGIYYGTLSRSKAQAKTSCATAILDKLVRENRLVKSESGSSSKKRTNAIGAGSTVELNSSDAKKGRFDEDDSTSNLLASLSYLSLHPVEIHPDEKLSLKTLYYLVVNSPKSSLLLLTDYIQSNKLLPPKFEFNSSGDSKSVIATGCIPPDLVCSGQPESNKRRTKLSAGRAALNKLIELGRLVLPIGAALPLDHTAQSSSSTDIFERFRSTTYAAFEQAGTDCPLLSYCNSKIAAFFLVDAINNKASIVSWACGNHFNTLPSTSELINDCDAEVLCRRGLLRFFHSQVKMAEERSIFYRVASNSKLRLRSNLSLHLFSSEAPTGSSHPTNALSVKIATGKTMPIADFQHTTTTAVASMSTANKMLKWSVVGVQGALLSQLMEPIYIQSHAIGEGYETARLTMERVKQFTNCQPHLAPVSSIPPRQFDQEAVAHSQRLCANWNAADDSVEIINPVGLSAFGGLSRLSTHCLTEQFMNLSSLNPPPPQSQPITYRQLKALSVDYQQGLTALKAALESTGAGEWLDKKDRDFKLAAA